MGRRDALNKGQRTTFIQIRCRPEYKERVVDLARLRGYPDVTAYLAALIEKDRQDAKADPFPPR